jgi:hypothetical protein
VQKRLSRREPGEPDLPERDGILLQDALSSSFKPAAGWWEQREGECLAAVVKAAG